MYFSCFEYGEKISRYRQNPLTRLKMWRSVAPAWWEGQPLMSSLRLLVPTLASFRNIWYLRFVIAFAIIATAVLLLAYDLLFFSTFEAFSNTTSYFPWAWGVPYNTFYSVQGMFCLAVAVIEVLLAIGGALLYYHVGPNLKKSLSTSFAQKSKIAKTRQ
jgi:hypothetical protein